MFATPCAAGPAAGGSLARPELKGVSFPLKPGLLTEQMWDAVLPLVGMGCALFLTAFCVVMLEFAERRRPLHLSIAVCAMLAAYCGLVAMMRLHVVPDGWEVAALEGAVWLVAAISLFVPWLLAEQFQVPHRERWMIVLSVLLLVELNIAAYDARELWMSRTMLSAALCVSGWAVWHGLPCAWAVLIGALLRLIVILPGESVYGEPTAFVIAGALVLFICRTLAAQGHEDRARVRAAKLTAARLEVELLKRHIQPHFLMNTLATLIEVIEQEPRTAVRLIEALATEFRILARVSGEKLIPLSQELELCRSHLNIMSIRKGLKCSLQVSGIDESATVPPGVFHTLIEGGLTHQSPKNGELAFALEGCASATVVRYTVLARGNMPPQPQELTEGTGLRYVKARLEESYAGRWSLSLGPVAEGWLTQIEIRAAGNGKECR